MVNSFRKKKIIKNSFKVSLIFLICSYTILLLTTFTIYGVINYTFHERGVYVVVLSSISMLVIFGALLIFFMKKIYKPIMKFESALKILENGDTDFILDTQEDIYPFSDGLSRMLKRLKESMDREHSAEILKKQLEFSVLQSQINPHFLYNTLEGIRGQALLNGNLEIAEMTKALARFFRYSISKSEDLVTLKDELSNIENYIIIQKYRFEDKFSFEIKYSEVDIEDLDYLIPKLTIQPLIENSIYHGLETKMNKGKITIHITVTEKRLIINITDNGLGMDKETLDNLNNKLINTTILEGIEGIEDNGKHTGIAVVNVNKRLKLLFGDEYGITVSSMLSFGTEVDIVLPIVKKV